MNFQIIDEIFDKKVNGEGKRPSRLEEKWGKLKDKWAEMIEQAKVNWKNIKAQGKVAVEKGKHESRKRA